MEIMVETGEGLTRHADGEVGGCAGGSLLLWCFSEPRLYGKDHGYPAATG